jgi:hypothetical protein
MVEQQPSKLNTRVRFPSPAPAPLKKTAPSRSREESQGQEMAEADLDAVIRSMARKQHKTLLDAAKKRHGRLMGLAAKAKNKESKDRLKQTAKATLLMAGAAARRLQITAENAADSYARSMKKAIEEIGQAAQARAAKKASGTNKNAKKKS